MIPVAGELRQGTVVRRRRDDNGKLIGKAHKNPLLDSSMWDVEFIDGVTEAFAANAIAEAIYAQVDDEGNAYIISSMTLSIISKVWMLFEVTTCLLCTMASNTRNGLQRDGVSVSGGVMDPQVG